MEDFHEIQSCRSNSHHGFWKHHWSRSHGTCETNSSSSVSACDHRRMLSGLILSCSVICPLLRWSSQMQENVCVSNNYLTSYALGCIIILICKQRKGLLITSNLKNNFWQPDTDVHFWTTTSTFDVHKKWAESVCPLCAVHLIYVSCGAVVGVEVGIFGCTAFFV